MKNLYVNVVMMIAAVVTLTACPGKKGNNAPAPAPAAGAGGVCTIGSNGQCVGQVAYTGSGRWSGYLNVAPGQLALYSQFLMENGLCYGYQCNQPTHFVGVSIRLNGPQGRVTITPYEFNGWSRHRLSRRATVSSANNMNSFNMVVNDDRQYIQGAIYPPPIGIPNNTIQLSNTFTTAYGNVITTTLFYRGVPVASGQLQGHRSDYYNGGHGQPTQYGQRPAVMPYQ